MELSWEATSCDNTAELVSGVAPLPDYSNDSLDPSPSGSQHEQDAMNPNHVESTVSARRKINASSAKAKNRDVQNASRDEGNGGYSPLVTNRYAVMSDLQMQSPGVVSSPQVQAQNTRRIGGGIRVQLFRDPDPEGEERIVEDVAGAQRAGQSAEQVNHTVPVNMANDLQLQPVQQLQQEQMALQESLQLQLQQQLHKRHGKLQLQMEQLQLQQQQLQQQENLLQQQQQLQQQLKQHMQPDIDTSAMSTQSDSLNHNESNLPECEVPINSQVVAQTSNLASDGAQQPSNSSENVHDTVGAFAPVDPNHAEDRSNVLSRESRSVTSGENGDGAEGGSSPELTQQSLEDDDADDLYSNEGSRSRHQSREADNSSQGGARANLGSQDFAMHVPRQNEVRLHAAGSELSCSDVEQLQLDMSSIHNSESEPELMDLHQSHDMEPLHPDGTDQSLAEEDEENQSEDAEADQFKLEPEADQSENFAAEHDFSQNRGLGDPLQHLAMAGVAWNQQMVPQSDFLGDDSQPEGERGPVQADGEEEEEDDFRPVYPPSHLNMPVGLDLQNNLDLRRYPNSDGMDREVVGMERGGDGAVAQVPFPQQMVANRSSARNYVSRIPAPVSNPGPELNNHGNVAENQGSGARRKTTIGAASKEKKSPPKNHNKNPAPDSRKQSSFPRMGAKAAGRSQGAPLPKPASSSQRPRRNNMAKSAAKAPKNEHPLSEHSVRQDHRPGMEGSSFLSNASGPSMPSHLARQGVDLSPIKTYQSSPGGYLQSPGVSSARELLQQMQNKSAGNSPNRQKYGQVQSRDINNMEQVRDQLHNILQMSTNELPERSLYDPDAEVMAMLGSLGRNTDDDNDVVYPTISGRALSDMAPNFGSLLGFSNYMGGGATNQSTTSMHSRPDAPSLMAENQMLKENMEKEKYRRKHCERQIQQLQDRMLELQQQLAVAVSTDRKKDLVIEQLDKTLAKIVEDWKRRESQKQEVMQQLRMENEAMTTKHLQQQQMLEKFEHELQQVVEQLAEEQQRTLLVEDERQAQHVEQEEQRSRLEQQLDQERERLHTLQVECAQLQEQRERSSRELAELRQTYGDETEVWEEREREYLQQVEDMTNNHQAMLEQNTAKYQRQSHTLQETQHALSTVQKDFQECQIELDSAVREKESLKVQMGLLEAREESSRRKLEADLTAEMEKQIRERLEEEREHHASSEEQLRERHRAQMVEMTQQHGAEVEQQLQQSHSQLQASQRQHQQQSEEMEQRLKILEEELKESKAQNKKLESQRVDLTSKLQSMMQSHCNEALRLLQLGSHVLSLSPAKPNASHSSSSLRSPGRSTMALTPSVAATTSMTFANSLLEASLLSTLQGGSGQQRVPVLDESSRIPTLQPVSGHSPENPDTVRGHGLDNANTEQKVLDSGSRGDRLQTSVADHNPAAPDFSVGYFQSMFTNPADPNGNGGSGPASLNLDIREPERQTRRRQRSAESVSSTEGARREATSLPVQSSYPTSEAIRANYVAPPGDQRANSVAPPIVQQSHDFGLTNGQMFPSQNPLFYGQVHGIQSQNSSLQSQGSGSDMYRQGQGQGQGHSQRSRPVQNRANSSLESEHSGAAVSRKPTAQGSFLSSLLQQAGDEENGHFQQEPQRLNDLDYSQISDKFDRHEDRQLELQRYIQMLLQRPPGTGVEVNQGHDLHLQEEPVLERKTQTTSSPRIVVFSPVKNQVTPPHAKRSPQGGTRSRGVMRHTAFSRDTVPKSGEDALRGEASVPESLVMKSHQSPKASKGPKGVGGLSPQQVGEISRLLRLYDNESDGHDGPPEQVLYSYLQDLQETNKQIHPTKDNTPTPPRGQRSHSDDLHGQTSSRAKRNLEATYDVRNHVINVPTATTSHHQKRAPHSQAPPTSQGNDPKPGPSSKKVERKVAAAPPRQTKSGRAWK